MEQGEAKFMQFIENRSDSEFVIFLPEIEALIEFDRPGDCW
jgi:hypothetical protein